jgi:hypothetical protein
MKNKKITLVLSSVVLASATLMPVSMVLAEESTSTVSSATSTSGAINPAWMRGGAKDIREQKRAEIKDIRKEKRDEIKDRRDEMRDAWKNATSSPRGDWRNATSSLRFEEMKKIMQDKKEARKAEMMKNQMASTSEKLLNLSAKLGTLGAQIKAVVEGQASSSEAIVNAISKVEGRGSLKTFLLGSDYKNLGQIISQVSLTQARIVQIENQISKMATSTEKTAAQESVQSLKDQIATLEQYVKDNINKFSLFGWLTKKL